jgi:hypothetical protein
MDAFLAQVVVDDLVTSFVRVTREFLLKRAQLEQQVQKTLKEAPLMAHITQMIMADNQVAAKIGSVREDPFGRLFHQAKLAFQFVRPWLAQAFRRLLEKHEVMPAYRFTRTMPACVLVSATCSVDSALSGSSSPSAWRSGIEDTRRSIGGAPSAVLQGYCIDFAASIAAEDPQRRLDRDRGELAYAIHRQAAPTAIGWPRSRRWMSGVGHRCRRRLRRDSVRINEDHRP